MQPSSLAVVVPRYHPDILGGAELHARWLAEHLAARGKRVTVLTTCTLDAMRWRNDLPPGVSQDGPCTVRRFPTQPRDLDRWMRLDMAIRAGGDLPLDAEEAWLRTGGSSPAMEEFLRQRGSDYDAVLGIPYMAATTYFAFTAAPERFCLIPCLHDEPFARLRYVDRMVIGARGTMANSWPELDLLRRLHPQMGPAALVGLGFDPPRVRADPELFRRKYGINGPFGVFLGRFEVDKNVPQLLDYFARWKARRHRDLTLVLAGDGDVRPPKRDDIVPLQIDWADRDSMLAAATLLFQPSLRESLSIVTMQAWQQGRPVLAHAGCDVVRDHCLRSNGGLWYANYVEFEAMLDRLLGDPALSKRMGALGRAYVERDYSWDAVFGRLDAALASWRQPAASGA